MADGDRFSAIEVREEMTFSQLTANASRLRARPTIEPRAVITAGRTLEACQRTVAVSSPSRSPNHL